MKSQLNTTDSQLRSLAENKACLLTKETGRNLRSLTHKAANVYLLFVLS